MKSSHPGTSKSRLFSALTSRNFRLFWFGQIISLTGTWMHSAAQGWLVLKLTDSPFYLGLVSSAASVPVLLFTLIGGVAADRVSKRKILLTTQTLLLFLAFTLAVLVSTGIVTVWHVMFIAFFMGAVSSFDIPARQSFLVEMVGKEKLMNAIALNSAAFNGTRIIGPTIAGILIGGLGLSACFYINAVSFLAAIIGILKMRFEPDTAGKRATTGVKEEFKEGLKYIFSEPKVFTLIVSVGIISFFGFPYIVFLPVYARDILKTGATGLGILMGTAGAGAFTGAISLAVRGDFRKKGLLLSVSGVVLSIALLIFSFSTTLWLSYIMLFLIGWGAISQVATANSLIQIVAPDRMRGRVMSSFTMVFLGMATLGNFAVGSMAHYIGTQAALGISAKFCLLGTILLLWRKPEIIRM
ncbi:MAG: MFS transporter [Nitrospirae bacterium]|nr:MFS transporter [Nitrospirota bacterium]